MCERERETKCQLSMSLHNKQRLVWDLSVYAFVSVTWYSLMQVTSTAPGGFYRKALPLVATKVSLCAFVFMCTCVVCIVYIQARAYEVEGMETISSPLNSNNNACMFLKTY